MSDMNKQINSKPFPSFPPSLLHTNLSILPFPYLHINITPIVHGNRPHIEFATRPVAETKRVFDGEVFLTFDCAHEEAGEAGGAGGGEGVGEMPVGTRPEGKIPDGTRPEGKYARRKYAGWV
jgi:hypothetical protein